MNQAMVPGKSQGIEKQAGQLNLDDILQVNFNVDNQEEKLRIDLLMQSTNFLNQEAFVKLSLDVQRNKLTQVQLKQINLVKTISTALQAQLTELLKGFNKIPDSKKEQLMKELSNLEQSDAQMFQIELSILQLDLINDIQQMIEKTDNQIKQQVEAGILIKNYKVKTQAITQQGKYQGQHVSLEEYFNLNQLQHL